MALEHERITILSELPKALDFFYDATLTWEDTDWNTKNHSKMELADALVVVAERLEEVLGKGVFEHEAWEKVVRGYADELGWKHGDMFLAIRSAVTGRLQSPPLLESIEVMGWPKAKHFIADAVNWLKN